MAAWTDTHTGELETELALLQAERTACETKLAALTEVEVGLGALKANRGLDGEAMPDSYRVAQLASLKTKSAAARGAA